MTPRQRLKELLYPFGDFAKDGLDALLEAASNEITILRNAVISGNKSLAAKQTELDQRNITLSRQDQDIIRLRAELVAKNEELARLRPPEPRFRVGQVVCVHAWQPPYHFWRICQISKASNGEPYYQCGSGNDRAWLYESNLRALTDEEK